MLETTVRQQRLRVWGVDLDAAPMADVKTIAPVDETIPLVPQAEPRVADA